VIADSLVVSLSVPAVSFGASGVVLLRTRARLAGAAMVLTGVGVLGAVAMLRAGHVTSGDAVLFASLGLAGGWALLAYPSARFRDPVDFCAWVVVTASGVAAVLAVGHSALYGSLGSLIGLTLISLTWWRIETGAEADRPALRWCALVLAIAALIFGVGTSLSGGITHRSAYLVLGLAAVGPAMVVGVLRPNALDARAAIAAATATAVAAACYVSLFVGALTALHLLGVRQPTDGALALVGLAAATTFHPLRVMLRGVIDELYFGSRRDPIDAATHVADRIGDDPVLALRAIREALVLPYASLSVEGRELATSGTAVTHTRRLPLVLGRDTVGEIVVGLRSGDLTLSDGDANVLRIVAPLLAQTLRARALAADLRASRGAAVAAIEEERRRLRRDLHDGLGPTLSGIAFTADAARNSLESNPDNADQLLQRLRADATRAIGEIRELVYGMRPPALDELGLVAGLRLQTSNMQAAAGRPMRVTVLAHDLPSLPAAIEVAAFRIATEAVTNSARHSGADHAQLNLACERDSLTITVHDGGRTSQPWVPGVGIASMRERAAEVGGTLEIVGNEQGTLVSAVLPLYSP
jgi:signal transduction histidine kinase